MEKVGFVGSTYGEVAGHMNPKYPVFLGEMEE